MKKPLSQEENDEMLMKLYAKEFLSEIPLYWAFTLRHPIFWLCVLLSSLHASPSYIIFGFLCGVLFGISSRAVFLEANDHMAKSAIEAIKVLAENGAQITARPVKEYMEPYYFNPDDPVNNTVVLEVQHGSGVPFFQYKAFPQREIIPSIVLLSSAPDDITQTESFFLWHELSHVMKRGGNARSTQAFRPHTEVFVFLLPIILIFPSAYGVLIFVILYDSLIKDRTNSAYNELVTDSTTWEILSRVHGKEGTSEIAKKISNAFKIKVIKAKSKIDQIEFTLRYELAFETYKTNCRNLASSAGFNLDRFGHRELLRFLFQLSLFACLAFLPPTQPHYMVICIILLLILYFFNRREQVYSWDYPRRLDILIECMLLTDISSSEIKGACRTILTQLRWEKLF